MEMTPLLRAPRPPRRVAWLALAPALCAPLGAAAAADLADVISDLYTEDGRPGITINTPPGAPIEHDAHFINESQEALFSLNEDIRSSVNLLAFNSTVTGFAFDIAAGVPQRVEESLGPLLAERAETLGRGNLNVAFTYSRLEFEQFDGDDLDDLQLEFEHIDCCGAGPNFDQPDGIIGAPPGGPAFLDFELDDIFVDIDLELEQDIFAFFTTYGITDRWDAGVVVPIVHTKAEARAEARIINRTGFGENSHTFVGASDDPVSTTGGEETGLGDVLLRSKYNFLRDDANLPDLAALGQVTLPTGDDDDLLGAGETGVLGLFIASEQYDVLDRATGVHLNVGYEVFTGDTVEDNLRFAAGTDVEVIENVTAGVDLLGRWEPDGENDLLDLGLSARWNPFRDAILDLAVIIPINKDTGLRPDFIPIVGFEYVF